MTRFTSTSSDLITLLQITCLIIITFGVLKIYSIFFSKSHKIKFYNDGIFDGYGIIKYKDIINITIEKNIQNVSLTERIMKRDTGRLVYDKIIFKLKDGSEESIITQRRYFLRKILIHINKNTKFKFNINKYKEPYLTTYEIVASISFLILCVNFIGLSLFNAIFITFCGICLMISPYYAP